jgi:hypothetical protein
MLNQTKIIKTMAISRSEYYKTAQFAFIKIILAGYPKQLQVHIIK